MASIHCSGWRLRTVYARECCIREFVVTYPNLAWNLISGQFIVVPVHLRKIDDADVAELLVLLILTFGTLSSGGLEISKRVIAVFLANSSLGTF